jgi:hypothetical protein
VQGFFYLNNFFQNKSKIMLRRRAKKIIEKASRETGGRLAFTWGPRHVRAYDMTSNRERVLTVDKKNVKDYPEAIRREVVEVARNRFNVHLTFDI